MPAGHGVVAGGGVECGGGVRTYFGAEGKPVAEKSAKTGTAGTTLTWLFSNLEGTVDVRTVASAAGVTSRIFRDPYGAPIGGSSGVWGSGTGYMNKPVTASTGLTTVGARTYDPVLGKFLSVDPVIGTNLPQQNTGYTYSGNNPTTYMDPTGLRLDEGCGWGVNCTKKAKGSPAERHSTPSLATSRVDRGATCRYGAACSAGIFGVRGAGEGILLGSRLSMPSWGSEWAGGMLASEQGSLIASWALGVGPNRLSFDKRSQITRDIIGLAETKSYVQQVNEALASGRPLPKPGGYASGAPGVLNTNLWRDGATVLFWPLASSENRTLVALGSHQVSATSVVTVGPNSAEVTFTATNATTLGSAVRGIGTTEFWNGIPQSTGPLSAAEQQFIWTEMLTW